LALGILSLCIILNMQMGFRSGASMQGGTSGNQFAILPAAGLLAKRADGPGGLPSVKTRGHAKSFLDVKSTVHRKTIALGHAINGTSPQSTSPRPPSFTGASPDRALCPGLIVPANSDCVLVIRILPNIVELETGIGDAAGGRPLGSSRGALELDIVDLYGKPVLSASIMKPWPKQGNAVVTLRALGASHAGCLSICRAGSVKKSINIYGKDDTLFGCISRDRSTSGYVLNNRNGECLLLFEGSFQEHRIHVLQGHSLMAHTETCQMTFDPEGHYYQARIAPGVDVGLVLSGLLAIDCMEAA